MVALPFVRDHQSPGDDDARSCREIARSHGRSFYLASLVLLPDQRRAIHAVYAFCRVADDIVDCMEPGRLSETEHRLDAWRHQIERPIDPVARAFARARRDYGIPVEPALELIEGIRTDLKPRRYETWAELERYCHAVAGTVGLLTAPILGCQNPRALDRAADLGIAMQLTNILRDVAEDARAGRIYLPLEDMEAFSCTPESFLQSTPAGNVGGLVSFEIARARTIYARALTGVHALDRNGQLATLAAARFYGEILAEIERAGCDVFRGRARVSTSRKLCKTPGVAAEFIRSAILGAPVAYGRTS